MGLGIRFRYEEVSVAGWQVVALQLALSFVIAFALAIRETWRRGRRLLETPVSWVLPGLGTTPGRSSNPNWPWKEDDLLCAPHPRRREPPVVQPESPLHDPSGSAGGTF